MEIRKFFLNLLLVCSAIIAVNCDCFVKVEHSAQLKPFFTRLLGSNVVGIKENGTIRMYEGENITAHCATFFKPIKEVKYPEYEPPKQINILEYDLYGRARSAGRSTTPATTTTPRAIVASNEQRSLELHCNSGNLYVNSEHIEDFSIMRFSCEPMEFGIYETKKPLPWCSDRTISYILSITNLKRVEILASLCFDLRNNILESLRFTSNNFTRLDQQYASQAYPIDVMPKLMSTKLKIEHFGYHEDEMNITNFHIDEQNELLKAAYYEERFIVQSRVFGDLFKAYTKLLSFPQWKYQVNWQRFMKALDERIGLAKYDINLGISGDLQFPIYKSCNGKIAREFEFQKYHSKIPAFIWSYVRALNGSEEFVFITYNSPYAEFFNSTEIIFCKDICSEISWLNKIRSTFRFTTMGLSFCCKAEAVRNSTILEGFPKIYGASQLVTVTSPPPVTTTAEPMGSEESFNALGWN